MEDAGPAVEDSKFLFGDGGDATDLSDESWWRTAGCEAPHEVDFVGLKVNQYRLITNV